MGRPSTVDTGGKSGLAGKIPHLSAWMRLPWRCPMMPQQNPRDPELLTMQAEGHGDPEHRRRRVTVHNDSDLFEGDRLGPARTDP
jgi:hypothetical protein